MKFIFSQMTFFLAEQSNQRNLRFMKRFMLVALGLIALYTALFHALMWMEGRDFSLIAGLYWTLTVMTTLGFGDIAFVGDLGRAFTILVTLSGIMLFMLVLPFTFIRFVYAPWIEAQNQAMVPTSLPEDTRNHVLVVGADAVAETVVEHLRQYSIPYVHILTEQVTALARYDKGYSVMLGEIDSPGTYKAARVRDAALVAALCDDFQNTNIASTVREISPTVRIAGTADHEDSIDILQLAGCNYTYHFSQMLGESLARRIFRPNMRSNIIAVFGELSIVEVLAIHTPYVGKMVKDTDLRNRFNLTVVGVWHGKRYMPAMPDVVIEEGAILLLAGTAEQIRHFDAILSKNCEENEEPVLIIGGGRVGTAVARSLEKRGVSFRLVDKNPESIPPDDGRFILGSAADIATLDRAEISTAHAAIVTTHDDNLNIYLTIYCRKLRPTIQIISRATLDRNVKSLYAAGANLVMSHATMAANTITNLLRPGRVVMLTEGLNIFRVMMPKNLVGVALKDSNIRRETKCNVVAVSGESGLSVSPDPSVPLRENDEIILIGSAEAERAFIEAYPTGV
ncbi:potassium transporter [Deltaproteobacteria bacterium]|nr:potassium transporter [Deltaproteobacteria bacterium]